MKKLSLKLDDLAVESFTTTRAQGRTGTVIARSVYTEQQSCVGCLTEEASACGGALCSYDACGGSGPMITCDDTTTMNDLVSQCVTATLAGPTCEGEYGDTCGYLCA